MGGWTTPHQLAIICGRWEFPHPTNKALKTMRISDITIVCAASVIDNGRPNSRGGLSIVSLSPDFDLEENTPVPGPITNNACELRSVLLAVERAPAERNVRVYTASEYVVKNLDLIPRWKANGWKNSGRKTVANRELWISLQEALMAKPRIAVQLLPRSGDTLEVAAAHTACQGLAQAAAQLASTSPTVNTEEPDDAPCHLRLVDDDSPLF